jgi:hypothetical protein
VVASSRATDYASSGERLGEVIDTSTTGFTAESDELHRLPELGALVRVKGLGGADAIYGVVAFGATGGLDSSRRAVRRGSAEVQDDAVYQRHPELGLVLRTIFDVAVIGFSRDEHFRHTLPPLPVPLHYNVVNCARDEVRAFTTAPRYLPALLSFRGDITPDALLASHFAWVDNLLDDNHAWLFDVTRRLARLMKRDYDQFATIMQAIEPD